jgi:hypothetical protein
MEPHKWFGRSWGAPVCETCDHTETPVGAPCLYCKEPILDGHQGVTVSCASSATEAAIPLAGGEPRYVVTAQAVHIDCFVRKMRPHGPECPHCRGQERVSHDPGCNYATGAGPYCSCSVFERPGR